MHNLDVIFDVEKQRIGIISSNCLKFNEEKLEEYIKNKNNMEDNSENEINETDVETSSSEISSINVVDSNNETSSGSNHGSENTNNTSNSVFISVSL